MNKRISFGEAVLVIASIIFCAAILLVGEVLTRNFSDITFFGNSENLFVPNAYGKSRGNAKNTEGLSFGAPVYTDELGFRIPRLESAPHTAPKAKAVFILGDSVAFGPGLDEKQTFSGKLRASFPDLQVYNSAVIGYSTRDYRNVVKSFVFSEKGIDRVFLLFCLNDVSNSSAREIERSLKRSNNVPEAKQRLTRSGSFVELLKNYEVFSTTNAFLRSNSKLYLLLKGKLTDPQARYWSVDYRLYLEPNRTQFLTAMQDVREIARFLGQAGIPLSVIIAPYEYQLRHPDAGILLPQRKLLQYFSEHSIEAIDSTSVFIERDASSKTFFLPYDPMHFSEKGHEIIYRIIIARMGLSEP